MCVCVVNDVFEKKKKKFLIMLKLLQWIKHRLKIEEEKSVRCFLIGQFSEKNEICNLLLFKCQLISLRIWTIPFNWSGKLCRDPKISIFIKVQLHKDSFHFQWTRCSFRFFVLCEVNSPIKWHRHWIKRWNYLTKLAMTSQRHTSHLFDSFWAILLPKSVDYYIICIQTKHKHGDLFQLGL